MKYLATLTLLLLAACAGNKARQEALFPAVQMVWPNVKADIQRGIDVAGLADDTVLLGQIEQIDNAVDNDNYFLLYGVAWSVLEPYGQAGIADRVATGEVHPLVADSLKERLKNFGASLLLLQDELAWQPPCKEKNRYYESDDLSGGSIYLGTRTPTFIATR